MAFEQDLFISYAHIDNQPLTPEQEGWITRFHRSLKALLDMRMGSQARIWRDDKLKGNDVFSDEIVDRFNETAVLVSVLTPRYMKSEWCVREVSEFCTRAQQHGGVIVGNKSRVFKVLKTPVNNQEPLPDLLEEMLGYEFYVFEDETPLELDPAYGAEYGQEFNRKVARLAADIAQLLEKIEEGAADGGATAPAAPAAAALAPAAPAAPSAAPAPAPAAPAAPPAAPAAAAPAQPPAAPAAAAPAARPAAPAPPAAAEPRPAPESADATEGVAEKPSADLPVIYLAQCGYDRKQDREVLLAELEPLGHVVLPDRHLPQEESGYVTAVEDLLPRCQLAIHLVGDSPGTVPDGPSGKSVVVLQNELAARRSKSEGLTRIVWLPEGTSSEREEHQAFIHALHNDAETQLGADLITGDIEQLKSAIHATLKKLVEPEPEKPAAAAGAAEGAPLVYLLCTEEDRKATVPIRKFLKQHGCEAVLPAFSGDAATVRKANEGLLATCDAVLLFYGSGEGGWKRTMDNELRKLPGYRGGKPLLAEYTYLAPPESGDKQDLVDMEEPDLIDGLGGFDESAMAAFLKALEAGGAA